MVISDKTEEGGTETVICSWLAGARQWVKVKFGASVLIMVIPHTFGARLNFNSHLHILASAGGLDGSGAGWTDRLYFNRKKLMRHQLQRKRITPLRPIQRHDGNRPIDFKQDVLVSGSNGGGFR